MQSALALFVPRVRTNHANHAIAADDLAIAADLLDRCLNSHRLSFSIKN
jgi:hypothetical protein